MVPQYHVEYADKLLNRLVPNVVNSIVYGCNVSTGKPDKNIFLLAEVENSTEAPLSITLDADGDGRDDIIHLEKRANGKDLYWGYLGYIDAFGSQSGDVHCNLISSNENLGFDSTPKRLFSADYNNDGLTDIFVACENGYTIYYNPKIRKQSQWKSQLQ